MGSNMKSCTSFTRYCVWAFVLLLVAMQARAQLPDDLDAVIEFTNAYISANSCESDPTNESRIGQFTHRGASGRQVPIPNKFAVLWHGDEGCTGGSGTNLPHISVVLLDSARKPQFLPGQRSTIGGFQVIDELVSASDEDGIVVIGSTWRSADAQCCATGYSKAVLKRGRHGFFGSVGETDVARETNH